jgi:hypothetical protein
VLIIIVIITTRIFAKSIIRRIIMSVHFSRWSVATGLFLGVSFLSGAVSAQEIKIGDPNKEVLCPHPATLQLQATATPSVNAQDFPTPLPAGQGVGVLNQAAIDHVFRYTFTWKVPEKLCCEITKGRLIVKLKWNGPAGPSSAGNDTIGIVHSGASVAGQGGYVWGSNPNTPSPTPYTGMTIPTSSKTINIDLNAASLLIVNHDNRLSFTVQDDTTVESAVLQLSGCCLNH